MKFNKCKDKVEKYIAKVKGVKAVTVDLALGVAHVEGDFNPDDVIAMIVSIGYEYIE